jgi:hypothetical protein
LGDHIAGALVDAAIGFTVVESDEAGEVAFGANSDGSVGDQCGEPQLDPSYRSPSFSMPSDWSIHCQVSTLSALESLSSSTR